MHFMMKKVQRTPIKLKKSYLFVTFFLCLSVLLFSFTLFHFHSEDGLPSSGSPALRTPANVPILPVNVPILPVNPYMIPMNTQMVIPPWVLEQYQLSQQQALYSGGILDFLIYNYGVAAPSADNSDQDTYYIPLNVYDSVDYADTDIGTYDTVMVDVTKLTMTSDDSSEKPTFKTTRSFDTRTSPDVPDPGPVRDPSKIYPVSCNKMERETEAAAPCASCVGADPGNLTGFLATMKNEVQRIGGNSFSTSIRHFCDSCGGVDIGEFVKYVERRAEEEKVPPEIIFGILLRESNGKCDASNTVTKCNGLFQMNMKNSTVLKPCNTNNKPPQVSPSNMKAVCQDGNYRDDRNEGNYKQSYTSLRPEITFVKYNNPYPEERCLNNPYCNFEESIHLLKGEKWYIGNKGENTSRSSEGKKKINKPTGKSWGEMDYEERNRWRNAIIAYNGAHYLRPAETTMKNEGTSDSASLNNWELKRMFFIHKYLDSSSGVKADLIENLAYVERIAGRETPEGFANSSICQWTQFRKDNTELSCKK